MAQKITFLSDLTGKEIPNDEEHASLVVRRHPTIDGAVRLDAHVLEAASLKDESVDLVQVEIHSPGYDTESLWVPLAKFDKLFGKGVDAQSVLENAEQVYETETRRRGRPAGSTNSKPARKPSGSGRSKEELQHIREWLRANGHEVSDRGRIKAELIQEWEAAH